MIRNDASFPTILLPLLSLSVILNSNTSILLAAGLSSANNNHPTVPSSANNNYRKVLRVCQSPGCKDDGATSTFDCLLAMAPPAIDVARGGCVSLCGSGPVVEVVCGDDDADSALPLLPIKKKRVKGSEAILSLLDECNPADMNGGSDALKPHLRDRLLHGYELSLQANEAYKLKNYQLAVELYTEAIESGRKPAMMLHEARIKFLNDADGGGSIDDEINASEQGVVRWLVTSFKNSCRSRLVMRDVDGARRDAFASTVFSRNLDADAHECLAEVSAASSDALGELQGLKAAIKQYDRTEEEYAMLANTGSDAPTRAEAAKERNHASARKRELGFRVSKLERILQMK
jgi:hypothetical protein